METPTFELTSPIIEPIIEDVMAAERTISKAKLEGDIRKLEQDAADAMERAKTLKATLRIYYPDSTLLRESEEEDAAQANRFDSLSIAEACELVLTEMGNPWLTLTDLDNELGRRGKKCSKGSIDVMLRNSDKFEVDKKGKRNVFRMKTKGLYDVNSRATK